MRTKKLNSGVTTVAVEKQWVLDNACVSVAFII
jgi:hypothetical protein